MEEQLQEPMPADPVGSGEEAEPKTFQFTLEEKAEMEARPIGSVTEQLTPESLALRRKISNRMLQFLEQSPWFAQRPEPVKALMRKYSFTDFYEDKDGGLARRVYGVIECEDDTFRLHVGTALMMLANDTVGGVSPEILRRIDNYSAKQLFTIRTLGKSAAVFLDPLGWQLLIMQRNQLVGDKTVEEECACGNKVQSVIAE